MYAKPICPYCGKPAVLVTGSAAAENGRARKFWDCKPCGAYVGTHQEGVNALVKLADGGYERMRSDGSIPLGTLANADLRRLRFRVHQLFDGLWREEPEAWRSRARRDAYAWLASRLHIPREDCHIAQFDTSLCHQAIQILNSRKEAKNVPLFG